jgi:hypothetical protein
MRGGITSKRRAEEFDALLSADPRFAADSEYADLLELVGSMRSVPEVEARPEFVADLRSRLMTAAESEQPVRVVDEATALRLTPHHSHVRRERRLATLLGGFAVASATTSMAVAAQGAMPGDVLYPVKRAIENAQTNLQNDDASRAETMLGHAERRLDEVLRLQAEGADGPELAQALEELTVQTDEAADLAIADYYDTGNAEGVEELRSFASRGITGLSAIGDDVPTSARPALVAAVQTLRQVDAAGFQACPACAGSPAELPDLALVASLDEMLSGQEPELADIALAAERIAAKTPQQPVEKTQPEPETPQPAGGGDDPQPADPEPTDEPDDSGDDKNDGPVTGLTGGLKDTLTGQEPGTSDGTGIPLIDGVTGLVDGLLSPLLP